MDDQALFPKKISFHQRLRRWAEHRWAGFYLFCFAFFESWIFPIPPDIFLIALVLGRPHHWVKWAMICMIGSVVGGMVGYAIGIWLYETLGQWVIHTYGFESDLEKFRQIYVKWGVWIILFKGLTPIPYKLVTIASGIAGLNGWVFLGMSILTRGLRFFIVGFLVYRYDTHVHLILARYRGWTILVLVLLIIAGFASIAFL